MILTLGIVEKLDKLNNRAHHVAPKWEPRKSGRFCGKKFRAEDCIRYAMQEEGSHK